MEAERVAIATAAEQHGVVSRDQALVAGLQSEAIDRRVRSGRWGRLHSGVYLVGGAPLTWRARLLAAVLWAGPRAAAGHRSAGELHRLPGVARGRVEVLVHGSECPRSAGVLIRRSVRLHFVEIDEIDRIPVTSIERTLVDLAAVTSCSGLELALDDALRRRLTTAEDVAGELQRLGRRGRKGAGRLARLVGARLAGESPLESRLEQLLERVLVDAALPPPRRQHEVRDGGEVVARLDFAFPEYLVAVEADGYRYHSGAEAWQRDLRRRNRLTALGWRVVHATWTDVRERPETLLARVRALLHRDV